MMLVSGKSRLLLLRHMRPQSLLIMLSEWILTLAKGQSVASKTLCIALCLMRDFKSALHHPFITYTFAQTHNNYLKRKSQPALCKSSVQRRVAAD